jgi:23S rRNA (cytidine1920-2'-O)/16S rRNA (cytidine1409-2'-O)-methyltransferase
MDVARRDFVKIMKNRLDIELLKRGLTRSRTQAQELIKTGKILVNGKVAAKSNIDILGSDLIELTENIKYVGRGGLKLEKALAEFKIDPKGMTAVDIGSSTGGFTDCLLQQGTAKVYAIDVGTDQLDQSLRHNPQVIVMEQTDIRKVTLPELVDIAVIDVSFISLEHILKDALRLTKPAATIIALIKPQFEVGAEHIGKNGIVKDEKAKQEAIDKVVHAGQALGLHASHVIESPITGGSGNVEYLVAFTKEVSG